MKNKIIILAVASLISATGICHAFDFEKYDKSYSTITLKPKCRHTASYCAFIAEEYYHDTHILITQCPTNKKLYHAQAFSIIGNKELIWWHMIGSYIRNGSRERPNWPIVEITDRKGIEKYGN